ncbi:MAG: hypothetical protein EAZ92_13350 [Candidatus Kapaibacterium sp.]|nr:MAG: hypothetical protein EAZ92_13350 [Candidatus Kapabacteria bacterium]
MQWQCADTITLLLAIVRLNEERNYSPQIVHVIMENKHFLSAHVLDRFRSRWHSGFLKGMSIVCVAVVFGGCSSPYFLSQSTTAQNTPAMNRFSSASVSPIRSEVVPLEDTLKAQPVVLTTGEVKDVYEELALVKIQGTPFATLDDLNGGLRMEARKLGANAIVRVQYGTYGVGYYSYPQAIGTAVKYK